MAFSYKTSDKDVMVQSGFPRGFIAKHPVFTSRGKLGVPSQQSAYYFWWSFLKLHRGYAETCRKGGKGRFAKLYADFGNVHDVEFREWWRCPVGDETRGTYLFAEPSAPTTVQALSRQQALDILDAGVEDQILLVAIPLSYSRRVISKRLAKVIREHHGRGRGQKRLSESKARYRLLSIPNAFSMQKILSCYELRSTNPKMPLWEVAHRAKVGKRFSDDELYGPDQRGISAEKAALTAAASRKLRHAELIIEGVGRGVFPVPLPTKRRDKSALAESIVPNGTQSKQ